MQMDVAFVENRKAERDAVKPLPGNIVKASLPFTAGVALAAALPQRAWLGAGIGCALTGLVFCSLLLVGGTRTIREGILLPACGSKRRLVQALLLYPLFFSLGFMCYWTHSVLQIWGSTGWSWLSDIAERSLQALQNLIDGVAWGRRGTAALLRALLSGDRAGLDPAVAGAFRSAGASHILALSGLHLGLLYGVVAKVMAVFGRSRAAFALRSVLTVALCGFYTLMTGAGPSLVRAFLFISLNEILRLSPGRSRHPLSVLCTALMIQLTLNPSVITSLGFQLSYLAMTGIFVIFPRLDAWFPAARTGQEADPVAPALLLPLSSARSCRNAAADLSAAIALQSPPTAAEVQIPPNSSLPQRPSTEPNSYAVAADSAIAAEQSPPYLPDLPGNTDPVECFNLPVPPEDESRQRSESRPFLLELVRRASSSLSRRIWSSAALSLSCQITTAPLVWLRFRTFPQYFLLTNLIALPLTSLLMFSSLATLTLSALGICPSAAVRLTDLLASALESSLEVIAEM